MNRTKSHILTGALGLALAAAAGGCGGDQIIYQGGEDASTDTADVSVGIDIGGANLCEAAVLPSDLCVAIREANTLENFCGPGVGVCEAGAVCTLSGDERSKCRQLCFPGDCETTCGEGLFCQALLQSDGTPSRTDLNCDGTPDVDLGACVGDVPGTIAEFEACGPPGDCRDGLLCLGLDETGTGTCFSACEGISNCEEYQGFASKCSPSTTDTNVCLIQCADEGPECPDGMTCQAIAHGESACLR